MCFSSAHVTHLDVLGIHKSGESIPHMLESSPQMLDLESSAPCLSLFPSQGTDAFSQAGLYSNHQDIGPRYAVSLYCKSGVGQLNGLGFRD